MSERKSLFVSLALSLTLVLLATAPAIGFSSTAGSSSAGVDLPDVGSPRIADSVSDAELEDLQTIANQKGVSIQAAIDRYAWNDNFALAVSMIREASPEAFAGAEIVDGDHAWVAFSEGAPDAALEIVDEFSNAHKGVSVEVRDNLGFTEGGLLKAIEAVHFAVLARPEVTNASTGFDYSTGRLTSIVLISSSLPDSVLDDIRMVGTEKLDDAGLEEVLDHITISVVRFNGPVLGADTSNTEHLGGEKLSTCTSGFGTKTAAGVRGISTAGHCGNSQSDDGESLDLEGEYEGTHGDFQWHTGDDTHRDDFYSGNTTTLEVNKRDVSAVGAPVVNAPLCKNGKTTYKYCEEVRRLNICFGGECNLIEMDTRSVQGGDSGGPVFYNNTAYGLVKGWHYAPFWPADRDLYSRADRIDNALNTFIATS